MKFLKQKKSVVAILAVAALAIAAVGAYAYWTTSGNGSGSATTGDSQAFVVSQKSGTSVTNLVPGGAAQTIDVTVNNPASFNQYLTDLQVTVANSDGSPWAGEQADPLKPVCDAGDFTIVQPTGEAGDLAPGDHYFTATIKLDDALTNQDNCKDITVPLYFAAS